MQIQVAFAKASTGRLAQATQMPSLTCGRALQYNFAQHRGVHVTVVGQCVNDAEIELDGYKREDQDEKHARTNNSHRVA